MSNIESAIAWGDTHPDEETAALFMEYLRANPVENLATGSVNQRAVAQGRVRIARPDGINMMDTYPGDLQSEQYEIRRAAEVLKESERFHLAIEIHSMRKPNSEPLAVIDPSRGVAGEVLGFIATWTSNIVTAETGMVPHLPHAFAAELSPKQLPHLPALRAGLDELINQTRPRTANPSAFQWFRYARSLNVAHLKPGTDLEQLARLPAFATLPDVIQPQLYEKWGATEANLLTMNPPSSQPNQQGYIAELVVPVETPDTASWPVQLATPPESR